MNDEITMSDMPPVQFSRFARSMQTELILHRKIVLTRIIDAVYLELENLREQYSLPSKEDLIAVTMDNTINWDPIEMFRKGTNQTNESYEEQKLAISLCKKAIDSYINPSSQLTLTKSVAIRGHPGAGKTFCMLYVVIYAITKGLFISPTAKMSHRALQLGGLNWDKILCLRGSETNINGHRRAELAINQIRKNRKREDFLLTLNVIFADELGQISAEEFALYEMILRNVRNSTVFMGGILIIGTLDHLQIQPIHGRPFLTANSIIPCFKMVALRHTVRATGSLYVELQSLVRRDYVEFENNPQLIHRFKEICAQIFTFVDSWNDERVTLQTFRVFSKKIAAKLALNEFQNRMMTQYHNEGRQLRMRYSVDLQKSRYSHDWRTADSETVAYLDKKCREPKLLLFEVGMIYTCTFNDKKKSNLQKAILFELPDQQTLDSFTPI